MLLFRSQGHLLKIITSFGSKNNRLSFHFFATILQLEMYKALEAIFNLTKYFDQIQRILQKLKNESLKKSTRSLHNSKKHLIAIG